MATTKTSKAAPGLSIFAAAAAKAVPVKAKAVKERLAVQVKGYGPKIAEFNDLKETIENAEAAKAIIEGELKEKGQEVFLKLYGDNGRMPENFVMVDGNDKVMFITMDKYIKVTDEKEAILNKLKPEVLDVKTEYGFNAEMLEKYADVISAAIQGIDKKIMSDDDKAALITAKKVMSIKKGTISNLNQYGSKMKEVYQMIQPIVALKNA